MSLPPSDSEDVVLRLTQKEALVFFELLSRFSETKNLSIKDQAEERVLWDLCCDLEKKITGPLSADYAAKLSDARRSIRD